MAKTVASWWSTAVAMVVTTVAVICLSHMALTTKADDSSSTDDNTNGYCREDDSTTCQAAQDPATTITYPIVTQEDKMLLYHYDSTTSTQDETKSILQSTITIPDEIQTVVVTASEQSNGRGTNGRQWMGARGNTFVTMAIRQQAWLDTSLSMTLLPIKVGVVMAERIDALLQSCLAEERLQINNNDNSKETLGNDTPAMTTIKWPNDVLVDERKISGVLIESSSDSNHNYWFLIGIGVNVAYAPQVPTAGPNQGRTATSINNYCPTLFATQKKVPAVALAQELGRDMAGDLSRWLQQQQHSKENTATKTSQELLQQWRKWVDWDMALTLRDPTNHETVMPLDIESDGRLRIRGADGRERLVVTDYFF